jgi:hypothetical protein
MQCATHGQYVASDPAFDVTRKWLAEEEVLGRQLPTDRTMSRSRRTRSARRASAVRSTSGDRIVRNPTSSVAE